MNIKQIKGGIGLALVLAMLAGCSSTSQKDEDAAAAEAEAAARAAAAAQQQAEVVEPEPEVVLETVFYFDFDESVLKPSARDELTKHAMQLKEMPRQVRIEGHTDERGSREYNMALGERRANAVRDFLVLQGVSAASIEVVSYGEERPAAMGSSESSWSQNRRAEVK